MKRILLAINGESPDSRTFSYAVGLCRRIRADLKILQFVKKQAGSRQEVSAPRKAGSLGQYMENCFAGVAFAEEGLPETARQMQEGIPESLKVLLKSGPSEIACSVDLSSSDPENFLSPYIDSHKDIVLTIFDPATREIKEKRKARGLIRTLKETLYVPLIVTKP